MRVLFEFWGVCGEVAASGPVVQMLSNVCCVHKLSFEQTAHMPILNAPPLLSLALMIIPEIRMHNVWVTAFVSHNALSQHKDFLSRYGDLHYKDLLIFKVEPYAFKMTSLFWNDTRLLSLRGRSHQLQWVRQVSDFCGFCVTIYSQPSSL